jgi:hypothetical protein
MPKATQSGRGMYETPQVTPDQLATETFGGEAPTHVDIIKSVNARAQKRHEMKDQALADLEVLPDSAELAGNEMIGVRNSGYLTKKGLEYGVNAMTFSLPPGMDIEDQEISDIRKEDMVVYTGGMSYPGDGWLGMRARGAQMPRVKDMGRPQKTNYVGARGMNPKNPRGQ